MKTIRLSGHARSQLASRGADENEIIDAIRSAPWSAADFGKSECFKDFTFGKVWNQKVYAIKRVRPIFIEEATEIVVITVYTYYF